MRIFDMIYYSQWISLSYVRILGLNQHQRGWHLPSSGWALGCQIGDFAETEIFIMHINYAKNTNIKPFLHLVPLKAQQSRTQQQQQHYPPTTC